MNNLRKGRGGRGEGGGKEKGSRRGGRKRGGRREEERRKERKEGRGGGGRRKGGRKEKREKSYNSRLQKMCHIVSKFPVLLSFFYFFLFSNIVDENQGINSREDLSK